ncbi:hypothetical protein ACFL56_02480 [Candidatus Margulisiibacteriota bacterium]
MRKVDFGWGVTRKSGTRSPYWYASQVSQLAVPNPKVFKESVREKFKMFEGLFEEEDLADVEEDAINFVLKKLFKRIR